MCEPNRVPNSCKESRKDTDRLTREFKDRVKELSPLTQTSIDLGRGFWEALRVLLHPTPVVNSLLV